MATAGRVAGLIGVPAAVLAAALLFAALLAWPGAVVLRATRAPGAGAGAAAGLPRGCGGHEDALLQVMEAVAAQVRGGATPGVAWDAAVQMLGHPLPLAGSTSLPEALRQVGGGRPAAGSVAAAWALAQDVGAPLADLLERLGTSMRQDADIDARIQVALAGPQATVRLLGVLPLVGVALGQLVGARPLHVLLGTSAGRLSGLTGLCLAALAHLWTMRLVARAAAR